jgi:hypothetical protein
MTSSSYFQLCAARAFLDRQGYIVCPVKPASGESTPANVVELSRFRADLSRGRRVRRADALLSATDPRKAVRALPGDAF